jgi:hypothetical protein
MFSVFCTGHGGEVLLWASNIIGMVNTAEGIELRWRCPCGSTGTWITGARREHPARLSA